MDAFLEEREWVFCHLGICLMFKASMNGNTPFNQSLEENKYSHLLGFNSISLMQGTSRLEFGLTGVQMTILHHPQDQSIPQDGIGTDP